MFLLHIFIFVETEFWHTKLTTTQHVNYFSADHWLEREKNRIDSLEANFQTIISQGVGGLEHLDFKYYLRVLNIQDSIATAKITGSVFPFAYPKIGDKINLK